MSVNTNAKYNKSVEEGTIYFDNNATTRPLDEVVEAMMPFVRDEYANPSSVHQFGQSVRYQTELAREKVAAAVNAKSREIVFTGSGTEAINLAIRGALAEHPDKRHIITSSVEHAATRNVCKELVEKGFELDEIPVDGEGQLDCERLADTVRDDTALVTLLWANNETGVLFDVGRIAEICKSHGVTLHLDAIQATGKVPIDVTSIPVHLLSLSAHKFHGPKGIGALYVRRGTRIVPMVVGGNQEREMRAGTENVAGIVGMGKAAERVVNGDSTERERVTALRVRLERGICDAVSSAHVNGRGAPRVGNTTNIGFEGLEAEALLILLSEQGICASSGSACSSGSLEPSHVLAGMGIDRRIAHGSVRFSLSRFTTVDEVDRVVEVMPSLVSRLDGLKQVV